MNKETIISVACFLLIAIISILDVSVANAAKKVKFNKNTITIKVGDTKTVKLLNNKKKVKWKVTSGKKYIKLTSKKKTSVKVTALKKGKSKIQAKVGIKKSYVFLQMLVVCAEGC